MNSLIKKAAPLPLPNAVPVISIAPVTLPAPGRGRDLEMRVSAPMTGDSLPVIVLSHGMGPSFYVASMDGYGPVANFWAAHGFVVIQPSHISTRVYATPADAPGGPLFWRSRVKDLSDIADQLDAIEAAVPGLKGRMDRTRLAVVGHSMGGQTAGMILGARLTDPKDRTAVDVDLRDRRYKAGILLAAPGNGADLSDFAKENYSALNPDFSTMDTPALVVVGNADNGTHLNSRGADWYADAYHLSKGRKALLRLEGGGHGLGGIAGYDAKETDDEDPDRLATTQRMTLAWLRTALDVDDKAWAEACAALRQTAGLGTVDEK